MVIFKTTANKEYFIEKLLEHGLYKMPDGRQLYEASERELMRELCTLTDNQYVFCSYPS